MGVIVLVFCLSSFIFHIYDCLESTQFSQSIQIYKNLTLQRMDIQAYKHIC